MASVAAEGVEAGEATRGEGGGSRKLLLAGLAIVLIAGGAGAAWFGGLLPGAEVEAPEAAAEGDVSVAYQPGALRALDPFVANLSDEGGGRYLKTTIEVEFTAATPPEGFDLRVPQVRDLVLTLLTSKSFDEIRTPAGKQDLREELIHRINHAFQKEVVKAVYFTDFIVQ